MRTCTRRRRDLDPVEPGGARGPVADAHPLPLHRWTAGLKVDDYDSHTKASCETVTEMKELSAAYEKAVKQEIELTAEQLVVATVGKVDAKKRIEDSVMQLMSTNIEQLLGTMLDTVVF